METKTAAAGNTATQTATAVAAGSVVATYDVTEATGGE